MAFEISFKCEHCLTPGVDVLVKLPHLSRSSGFIGDLIDVGTKHAGYWNDGLLTVSIGGSPPWDVVAIYDDVLVGCNDSNPPS